jgi:phytoene dehydrogenase-like protein
VFLRSVKAGNGRHEYLRLVENYREGEKIRQRVVVHIGRKDLLAPHLDALVRLLQPDQIARTWISAEEVTEDYTESIERQIVRFAPEFRDCILSRSVSTPKDLESWNSNLVGGDILGGAMNVRQLLFRPTRSLYRTSRSGLYLCGASTPPGGGVHGMCGFHAAKMALKDLNI